MHQYEGTEAPTYKDGYKQCQLPPVGLATVGDPGVRELAFQFAFQKSAKSGQKAAQNASIIVVIRPRPWLPSLEKNMAHLSLSLPITNLQINLRRRKKKIAEIRSAVWCTVVHRLSQNLEP